MKKPKTSGYQWLEHSISAFNGTRYCNRTDGESFLESYIGYNQLLGREHAVKLANQHWKLILPLCEDLAEREYQTRKMITPKQEKFIWALEEQLGRKHRDHSHRTCQSASQQIKKLLAVKDKRQS